MSAGMAADQIRRRANRRAGHTLCEGCDGTGNELYSMYRACQWCGGSGYKVRFGEHPTLIRKLALRRERRTHQRAVRGPRDWRAETRWLASYMLGVGHWFSDRRDRCRRCDAMPSDIDFEMRRVGPFRAECVDSVSCQECVAELKEGER